MRNLDDGCARVVQSPKELHDLLALGRVQIAGGFVGEDELGILNDGAGDAHKLLLSAGKLIGEKILLADDVELIKRVTHKAGAFLARNVLIGERNLEVFKDRQVVNQVVALKNKADVGLVKLIAFFYVQFVNGLFEEVELSGPCSVEHADDAQESGLSGARRPHDGDELALVDIEVDAAEKEEFVRARFDCFFEITQLNQWFHNISLSWGIFLERSGAYGGQQR